MSFAAVQKHVAVLERAGLVTKERQGRETHVRTDIAAIRRAGRALDVLEDMWRSRIDRFETVLAEATAPTRRHRRHSHRRPPRRSHTMTVTNVSKDPATATMAVTAEFDATTEAVWQLWADPRLLEQWWGPPTYPATMVDHDLVAGGRTFYYMTSPEGQRHHGLWSVLEVDPPKRILLDDRFADADGAANSALPNTVMEVTFDERADGGTTMTIRSTFPSSDAMEQMLEMGMEEGLSSAMGQMDALLAVA